MVEVVSTQSIKGIRSGKSGYGKEVSSQNVPLVRGNMKFFRKVNTFIYQGTTSKKTTYFSVPENERVHIDRIESGITSEHLFQVEIYKDYFARTGETFHELVFRRFGYGEIKSNNIDFITKGETEKTFEGESYLVTTKIRMQVSIYTSRPGMFYGILTGVSEPK